MLKKLLPILLLAFQINSDAEEKVLNSTPTSNEVSTAQESDELSAQEAELILKELIANPDSEIFRRKKYKKFHSILVSCLAKIGSLGVCGNATICGNLSVGGKITSAATVPVTIAAPVNIVAPISTVGPLTVGSCTLTCTAGGLVVTSPAGTTTIGGPASTTGPLTIGSCTLTCTPAGLVVTSPAGTTTIGGAGAVSPFAMFFGLTAGTGMIGTDYAATIPVKTSAGTGRVPFPQNGPLLGSISRIDSSSFLLPDIGTYEINFRVHTTEPGQLQLELNNVDVANTVAVNMNPTSGGHPIIGSFFITTTSVNSTLAVINPTGNSTALTITPANGAETHANSQSITIKRIA